MVQTIPSHQIASSWMRMVSPAILPNTTAALVVCLEVKETHIFMSQNCSQIVQNSWCAPALVILQQPSSSMSPVPNFLLKIWNSEFFNCCWSWPAQRTRPARRRYIWTSAAQTQTQPAMICSNLSLYRFRVDAFLNKYLNFRVA